MAVDPSPAPFRGFPREAIEFYEGLALDNSRAYWLANKQRYEHSVRAPMLALLHELDEFGPFHIFRPYNDVRFAKNKPPYKDGIGAYGESEGGAGFYVQLSAAGLLAGSGYYAMASDQLERFRTSVDDEHRGGEIAGIVEELHRSDLTTGAISELKTAPRGYPKNHPRIGLLRRKGLVASRAWPVAGWLHTKKAADRVRATWRVAHDMNAWLDAHVGPSQLAPDDAERF
ncbi:MAG: DUF2461 domain-containing protein [Acidimicrobiia bacterium]